MNKTVGLDFDTMMGLTLIVFLICATIVAISPDEHCECCSLLPLIEEVSDE